MSDQTMKGNLNATNEEIAKLNELDEKLKKFLEEKGSQLRELHNPNIGNQFTAEENFFMMAGLFYWAHDQALNWVARVTHEFEEVLRLSGSPYLKEFYDSNNLEIPLSPCKKDNESKGG